MDDVVVRLVLVLVVAAVVAIGAWYASRRRQPVHPRIDLTGTDLPTGAVLFTSVDCRNCEAARRALRDAGIEFREVTWELEGALFDQVGVTAVPLAVFRDPGGATVAQIAGVPRPAALRRARGALRPAS